MYLVDLNGTVYFSEGIYSKSTTEWICDGEEVQLDTLELDPMYRELRLEKVLGFFKHWQTTVMCL